jgi:hypothetical protein
MSGFLLGVPGRLKTLLDRLTADRASRLDEITSTRMARLNADISSRAPASDVTTLLDRLTATRAGYLNADISSRAPASDVTTLLNRLTETRAGYLDAAISSLGGGTVKSIQTGVLFSQSTGSGAVESDDTRFLDITISSVDASKSVVIFRGTAGTGTSLTNALNGACGQYPYPARCRLTSNTNVRVHVSLQNPGTRTAFAGNWTVVEYA